MKSLTKTITAYSFNELDEFTQADAKRSVLDYEHLPEFFSQDLTETLKEDFGLHHLKTYYSLSYCQGDGLCLHGNISFSELFENGKFKKIAFKDIHPNQIKSVRDELQKIDFIHRSRYCHVNTVCIESHEYDPTEKQMAVIEKIVSNVKSWYLAFCKEWEKRGYDYFYEISDDDMEMVCSEYDFLFTEEGKLVNKDEFVELT
jgi:hypothetical protein